MLIKKDGVFISYLDSIYFCVVTTTTVGYGDIAPQSEEARVLNFFEFIKDDIEHFIRIAKTFMQKRIFLIEFRFSKFVN